tara:strand:- start:51 stop:296 length:246 start_codon:yes stop_codon:yes gene_type:complete
VSDVDLLHPNLRPVCRTWSTVTGHPVAPAPQFVCNRLVVGIVNHKESTVVYLYAIVKTGVVGGPLPTPTTGFYLDLNPLVS